MVESEDQPKWRVSHLIVRDISRAVQTCKDAQQTSSLQDAQQTELVFMLEALVGRCEGLPVCLDAAHEHIMALQHQVQYMREEHSNAAEEHAQEKLRVGEQLRDLEKAIEEELATKESEIQALQTRLHDSESERRSWMGIESYIPLYLCEGSRASSESAWAPKHNEPKDWVLDEPKANSRPEGAGQTDVPTRQRACSTDAFW